MSSSPNMRGVSDLFAAAREDVEARVWEHNNGPIDGYTARRRPVTLMFCEVYDRLTDAIARERQIKGWGRAKRRR